MKAKPEEWQREDSPRQPQTSKSGEQGVVGAPLRKARNGRSERLSYQQKSEINRANRTTHGLSGHPLYRFHRNIKRRTKNTPRYVRHGIFLHEPWSDVVRFISEVEGEIGPRPSKQHSLDRIDNDAGYVPGNLRWADPKTQANNRGHRGWVAAELTPCLFDRSGAHSSNLNPCDRCPLDQWLR